MSPRIGSYPNLVYSTPGLGHIVQDFALYVPLPKYSSDDVKEVQKQIQHHAIPGGLDLNPPLIQSHGKGRKRSRHQKGDGNTSVIGSEEEEDREIENALDHPIKV